MATFGVARHSARRYRSGVMDRQQQDGRASRTVPRRLAPAMLRDLELHEARALARGGRVVHDLGDAILLLDPVDPDPFLNRLTGLRLPSSGAAFDRRLAELQAMFVALRRRPHVLVSSRLDAPADLLERLEGEGFVDVGGTYPMVQFGAPTAAARMLPPGAQVEWLTTAGERQPELARGAARVMTEAFAVEPGVEQHIARDLARPADGGWDVCVISCGAEPVAAGRRFTVDGMTYLSSIGTRRAWWGQGFGAAVTSILADSGVAAGGSIVHLSVDSKNARALRLYRRLGFETVGDRIADLLLA
jgi:ribosomal protein S18 acetylase RimI-like enzyme